MSYQHKYYAKWLIYITLQNPHNNSRTKLLLVTHFTDGKTKAQWGAWPARPSDSHAALPPSLRHCLSYGENSAHFTRAVEAHRPGVESWHCSCLQRLRISIFSEFLSHVCKTIITLPERGCHEYSTGEPMYEAPSTVAGICSHAIYVMAVVVPRP